MRDFVEYRDALDFQIPSGYNAPTNIASDMTAQMHCSSELLTKYAEVSNKATRGDHDGVK